jgi:ATP-dependent Clp protease ATP-binding subunit ClpA
MFERYTERARRVIFFARYYASEFGSTEIGTEHLLLGLFREERRLCERLSHAGGEGVIRQEVERRVAVRPKISTSVDMALSNECKRILAYADDEREKLGHRFIGTQHVLLGILREEKCVAAQILHQFGFQLAALRTEFANSSMWDNPEASPRGYKAAEPSFGSLLPNPQLPDSGVVPDAATAKRIAEAVWKGLYGPESTSDFVALEASLEGKLAPQTGVGLEIWKVTAASQSEQFTALILRADGRILSVGRKEIIS